MRPYEGFPLQVSLTCPSCHQPVHLQGISERALCGACQSPVELGPERWVGWFGPEEFGSALSFPDGQAQQVTAMGGMSAKYAYGHRMPRCRKCEADVPADALDAAADAGGLACGCGEWIRVRRAPDLARVLMPQAVFLVSEGPLGDDTEEDRPGAEPVLFQCMACGGSLRVDGATRTVTCQFCSGSNYLPDGLWLRLHPPRTVRTFFLVARMDGAARKAVRAGSGEGAVEVARDLEAPVELLAQLAASSDSDVRKSVAANEATPSELLVALAADDDWEVRRAVARNPAAPPRALNQLARDSDSDVVEALASNPVLPLDVLALLLRSDRSEARREAALDPRAPEDALVALARQERDRDVLKSLGTRGDLTPAVLVALAGNSDYDARRVAASHPNTPRTTLAQLAADSDSDVLKDLVRRPDLPEAVLLSLGGNDHTVVAELARAHPGWAAVSRKRRLKIGVGLALFTVLVVCAGGAAGSMGLLGFVGRKLMKQL